jgi:hypothetical protein
MVQALGLRDITALESSYLDGVLAILDGTGYPIAFDEENGSSAGPYPSADAFVQCVLPADGTYFIRVTDEWDEGDTSDYGYQLHPKLK